MTRDFVHGQRVAIDGTVGDEQGTVPRGMRGRVLGDNPTCRGDDGVRRVNVQLENGDVVAVPDKALRSKE